MSGRIKLLKNGEPINLEDSPTIGSQQTNSVLEDNSTSELDIQCGTQGLESYALPNAFCPTTFICDKEQGNEKLQKFAQCIDAMNCAMLHGMTTKMSSGLGTWGTGSEIALFNHQMIPHHQNAVNMAKALLKSGGIDCNEGDDEDSAECTMNTLAREIINAQNQQIMVMQFALEKLGASRSDNCDVPLSDPTSSSGRLATAVTSGLAFITCSLFLLT
jgi:hypothetical protein